MMIFIFKAFVVSVEMLCGPGGELPEKLRNLEPRLIEHVSNEIMEKDPNVRWNDIGILKIFFERSFFYWFHVFKVSKLFLLNLTVTHYSWLGPCKEMRHRDGYMASLAA